MGFFDIFRRKATPAPPRAPHRGPTPAGPGFAVVDVETTGLSPNTHRVVELAILRTDAAGRVVDEWVSRFNPDGPVGAAHVHGITAADVAGAPRFAEVLPEITTRLSGVAVAGHNVRFDLGFLRAEFARAGWALPHLPAACTLEHSWDHLPHLDRRRLADCCAATGVRHAGAHSALGDARATPALPAHYLDPRSGRPPARELTDLPQQGALITWPTKPRGPRPQPSTQDHVQRRIAAAQAKPPAEPLMALLRNAPLADALDDGAPPGSLPYLELLADVLEDGVITDAERTALAELAALYDLDADGLAAAHRGFLLALAHLALDDGRVTKAEKAELTTTAALLDVPATALTALLDAAETARTARLSAGLKPLPAQWAHGEPLRVGDKVAFTGDSELRDELEQRAERLGVRVMGNVSRRTALLVTCGDFTGTKAKSAASLGTRCVPPEDFAVLLEHLQPAARPTPAPQRTPKLAPTPPAVNAVAVPTVSPAEMRAWARTNGYEVSDRGRVPADVVAAYKEAHP